MPSWREYLVNMCCLWHINNVSNDFGVQTLTIYLPRYQPTYVNNVDTTDRYRITDPIGWKILNKWNSIIHMSLCKTLVSPTRIPRAWCGRSILASSPSWGRPATRLLSTSRLSPTPGWRGWILQLYLANKTANGMFKVHGKRRMVELYSDVRLISTLISTL